MARPSVSTLASCRQEFGREGRLGKRPGQALESGGGELYNDGEGVYATTNEEFGDFELLLQYRRLLWPIVEST